MKASYEHSSCHPSDIIKEWGKMIGPQILRYRYFIYNSLQKKKKIPQEKMHFLNWISH